MKIDLHVHTEYSEDSLLKLEHIAKVVAEKKVDAVAITDHNEVEGAIKLKKASAFPVIVGEEIESQQGDIIGLFLQERIEPGLTAGETITRIKNQGGLVLIPHPFDRLRSSATGEKPLKKLVEKIDIIEVLNARNIFPADNQLAFNFALKHNLLQAAGSDAHTKNEVGNAYVETNSFTCAEDFLIQLHDAKIGGGRSSLLYHAASKAAKFFSSLHKMG